MGSGSPSRSTYARIAIVIGNPLESFCWSGGSSASRKEKLARSRETRRSRFSA